MPDPDHPLENRLGWVFAGLLTAGVIFYLAAWVAGQWASWATDATGKFTPGG